MVRNTVLNAKKASSKVPVAGIFNQDTRQPEKLKRRVDVVVTCDNYLQISDGAHSLTLCHYPMLSFKHFSRSYMIHGHIHANTEMDFWPCIKARDNVLNAGVDLNGFQPVTFEALVENNRRFKEMH